ncbi:MAG: methyltransferase domain-containing protein, partial [Gemmatimonadaceae bacterium]|nr:methyltransferase domain-containing protein [Gemmatimonadaceae bacterium]
ALLGSVRWAQVVITQRPANLGLHASLRAGLDDFFSHESAGVVIEEDIRLADGAYAWLSAGLDHYSNDATVGSLSAWTHPRVTPADATGSWWSARPACWGWASWARAWKTMAEPYDALVARCAREGIDIARNGDDAVALAARGNWDAQIAIAFYGSRLLTLYPPRSLADHLGVGGDATNQHSAGAWRAVPASPLGVDVWPWSTPVEHPQSAELWRRAAATDAAPIASPTSRRFRRQLGALVRRVRLTITDWPRALALRFAVASLRAAGERPYEDDRPHVTTPIRHLWLRYLHQHRDAFFGRALEIGNTDIVSEIGGAQLAAAEVLDVTPGANVQYVADLERGWTLPEGRFDVFLNQYTIHLLADDRAALWHSIRVLREGGTLFVNFPCTASVPPDGFAYLDEPTHVLRWYTLPGVRALLRSIGIDDAHAVIEPLGGAGAIAAYVLNVPVEAIGREVVERVDPRAPLEIGVRITKPVGWAPAWTPPR